MEYDIHTHTGPYPTYMYLKRVNFNVTQATLVTVDLYVFKQHIIHDMPESLVMRVGFRDEW